MNLSRHTEPVASIEVDVALLRGLQISTYAIRVAALQHRLQDGRAETLSLRARVGPEHRQIPVGHLTGMSALHANQAANDQRRARKQTRMQQSAGELPILTRGRLPAPRRRPQGSAAQIGSGPYLVVGEQLTHPRIVEALEHPQAQPIRPARPPRHRIVQKRPRQHTRERGRVPSSGSQWGMRFDSHRSGDCSELAILGA